MENHIENGSFEEPIAVEPPTKDGSVSIYKRRKDAMDEFPVLKAFQQYIDAEQAKARKRLIALSIVFSILTLSLVGVFMVILNDTNDRAEGLSVRNQELNDRLVDFAMKERENAAKNLANEATVKAMTETISSLKKQLDEQQEDYRAKQAESERLKAEVEKSRADAARQQDSAARLADAEAKMVEIDQMMKRQQQEAEEKIRQLNAEIAASKKRLDEERKRQAEERKRQDAVARQEEIERYRREHYPEYYAKSGDKSPSRQQPSVPSSDKPVAQPSADRTAEKPAAVPPPAKPTSLESDDAFLDLLNDDGEMKPIQYFKEESATKDKSPSPNADAKKPTESQFDDLDQPLEYFKDDKMEIPVAVKVKGEKKQPTKWRVPIK